MNKQIWSTVFLTISNLFFTTIFSGFLIFGSDKLKDITLKYLITFQIALTKFYIFILTNCLLNTMDNGNIELLSNSAIISLFLSVYHFLSFIITDILDITPNILIIFLFSIGILFFSLFIVLLILMYCIKDIKDCCCDCCKCC